MHLFEYLILMYKFFAYLATFQLIREPHRTLTLELSPMSFFFLLKRSQKLQAMQVIHRLLHICALQILREPSSGNYVVKTAAFVRT